jgi:formyltetrahydrofolate-dependent phosphoribosylglycinamide formyltransferase
MRLPKVAILISGTGTNMEALLKAMKVGELEAEPAFVGSDKAEAKGLKTAALLGVDTKIFRYDEGKAEAEAAIEHAVKESGADWIVLAGYMRILSANFVKKFPGKIINIHPSLLPSFPGAHGIKDAWEFGVKVTGVTVHKVDELVDHGEILAQEAVDIADNDTLESLEAKIHRIEHQIYKRTLKKLFAENPVQGKYNEKE